MLVNTRYGHVVGATILLLAATGLVWVGQPNPMEKWQFLAAELQPRLERR